MSETRQATVMNPLGIMPRYIHEEKRASELIRAIERYHAAGFLPHAEWAAELAELISTIKGRGVKAKENNP